MNNAYRPPVYYDIRTSCSCGRNNFTIPLLEGTKAHEETSKLMLRHPNLFVQLVNRGTYDESFIAQHEIGIH
jgi:hypothetical protein